MLRKLAIVVLASAFVGLSLGNLGHRLIAAKKRRPPSIGATGSPVVPPAIDPREGADGSHVRHDVTPLRIFSPGPGLIRIDGVYKVAMSAPWEEDMLIGADVTDMDTRELITSEDLFRHRFGKAETGKFPIARDIPVPPGRYLVRLYVREIAADLEQLDGSVNPHDHMFVHMGVLVK